jgi:hypothetical protein
MMAGSTNVGFFTVYYISICDFWAFSCREKIDGH